jgi:hypothetical protein
MNNLLEWFNACPLASSSFSLFLHARHEQSARMVQGLSIGQFLFFFLVFAMRRANERWLEGLPLMEEFQNCVALPADIDWQLVWLVQAVARDLSSCYPLP